MSQAVRNEISLVSGIISIALLAAGKKRTAAVVGGAALGLKLLPENKFDFQNKTVVVSGGSRGLGLSIATEVVARGGRVAILARDIDELIRGKETIKKTFPEFPNKVLVVPCDVTDPEEVESAFSRTIDEFGRIDVLINNAGSIAVGPFETMTMQDFEAQMKLHFFAPLNTIRAILPTFKKQKFGRIVNISSIGGKVGVPHMTTYSASKFALAGFSEALSEEIAKDNILVTTIYPGLMRTGSPVQAVFKGDHEKEFAWFATSDSAPGLTVSAQSAAKQILNAVESNKRESVLTLPAKAGVLFHDNFPETFISLMSLVNTFLPQGSSTKRKTGADSRELFDTQPGLEFFRRILNRSQKNNNQWEKSDADFNLNAGESLYP